MASAEENADDWLNRRYAPNPDDQLYEIQPNDRDNDAFADLISGIPHDPLAGPQSPRSYGPPARAPASPRVIHASPRGRGSGGRGGRGSGGRGGGRGSGRGGRGSGGRGSGGRGRGSGGRGRGSGGRGRGSGGRGSGGRGSGGRGGGRGSGSRSAPILLHHSPPRHAPAPAAAPIVLDRPPTVPRLRGTKKRPVLVHLYQMLNMNQYKDVVRWGADGDSVEILNEDDFIKEWNKKIGCKQDAVSSTCQTKLIKAFYRSMQLWNFSMERPDDDDPDFVVLRQMDGKFYVGCGPVIQEIQRKGKGCNALKQNNNDLQAEIDVLLDENARLSQELSDVYD